MKPVLPTCEKCYEDFQESLEELHAVIKAGIKKEMDDKSQERIIRTFEVTHELAVRTVGEYFRKQGRKPFTGSREATVEAFNEDLIDDGKGWLDMIIDRIKYNPVYPEDFKDELVQNISGKYLRLLSNFERKFQDKMG